MILALGVATWIYSDLKFQADMGIMLTFMFLMNMLGAILLLPALASWLLPRRYHVSPEERAEDVGVVVTKECLECDDKD